MENLMTQENINIINEELISLGISPNLSGYRYIRRAIMLCLEDDTYIFRITKQLYPDVASLFNTTPARVERGIRHAIKVAFNKCDCEILRDYFGNVISNKDKATNSEFISVVAERLRYKLKGIDGV